MENHEHVIIRSIEDIQSEQILSTSTISIERIRTISVKSNDTLHSEENVDGKQCVSAENIGAPITNDKCCDDNGVNENDSSVCISKLSNKVDKIEDKTQKKQLIAWSILKDFRFLCFCLSNFLLTLPPGGLFLPSLAKDRGVSGTYISSAIYSIPMNTYTL